MTFARKVFLVAGVWGIAVLTPLYFTFDLVGRSYPPAITHPDFYYGFVSTALAWQIGFLVIASDPIRYRGMMIVAFLEKSAYVVTMTALFVVGRVQGAQALVAIPDGALAALFIASMVRTPHSS